MGRYFFESLLITTTSKATNSMPITLQSHMPPPDHPHVYRSSYRSLRYANAAAPAVSEWRQQCQSTELVVVGPMQP